MQILRLLLFPFSLVYGFVILVRNKCYDWGWFKSREFQIPIISVGNLEVGGAGKTPMVEYLIRLLKSNFKVATLSRGYGRKTKGFRWVKPDDEASQTGDEPLQIKRKFENINVAVCENRVVGIQEIRKNYELILMDDAFQHRAIKPGLSILLFDYFQLNKASLLLPTGNYRESFRGRKRADILIVTKTPEDISSADRLKITENLRPFPYQKVFFSAIAYHQNLNQIFTGQTLAVEKLSQQTHILLITGIAKTAPLLAKLQKYSRHIIHHAYADHHQFSQKNMLKLVTEFKRLNFADKIIITTEKDAVRLKATEFSETIKDLPIYEWPIAVTFDENGKTEFDNLIKKYAQHQRIN